MLTTAPVTAMAAASVSLDGLQIERHRRRREAISVLREWEKAYRGELKLYGETCRNFLRLLDRMPREVVYAYERTTEKLLEVRFRMQTRQRQLAAGNVRIMLEERTITTIEAAKRLIQEYDPKFLECRPDAPRKALLAHAVTLLDGTLEELDKKLASLKSLRETLVAAARAIAERVHNAERLGLMSRTTEAVIELEALIDYWFPGSVAFSESPKAVRRAAMRLCASLVRQNGLRGAFKAVAHRVYQKMEASFPSTLQRKKRGLFTVVARELTAQLDGWDAVRTLPACNRLAIPILGLRFSFTSARHGLGGLSAKDQASYERELAAASPADVRHAIEALVQLGLLDTSDCELFRYTPSVGRPFREFRPVLATAPSSMP